MLSSKHATLAIKILSLLLVAVLSYFVVATRLPESGFVQDSLESVEESSDTVMRFSAATLSTSLAISALPDDFGTPLADSLADMNIYFVAILVVLFLEKLLIRYGIQAAFAILIPLACLVWTLFIVTKKDILNGLAARLCVLGLAVAFVIPCSTHITDIVASDLTAYVDGTIQETEDGASKLNEAMEDGAEDKTMFEKLSDLFQTAVHAITDRLLHFQNTIRRCMNAIAILILTDCLMPLLTFLVLKWILKEIFQIVVPPIGGYRIADPGSGAGPYPGSGSRPDPGSEAGPHPRSEAGPHPGSGSRPHPGSGSGPHPGSSPMLSSTEEDEP